MKFLIWALLGYLVYRMFVGKAPQKIEKQEKSAAETFQDPVCGVYIAEADAVVGRLEGKRYHFCSMECLRKFEAMQQRQ
ncbi:MULTISPECIES: YHS domain-containing protein [Geomonas]|nr:MULTISPECIES: YHS domain-containing protein [Geomonas]